MKVAFFIGRLSRGGMETLVLDTFRKRDVAPFDCILVYRNDGELTEDYRATGVPMYRIKPTANFFRYVLDLSRLLKREKVDILHTQTVVNGLIGVVCKLFSGVRLVSSFHGFLSKFKYKVYTHVIMWNADASVFVSDYEREWYLNHILFAPKKRSHVVYNGIDFTKFDKHDSVPEFLDNAGSSMPGSLKLSMVGNFVSGRSQLFLCHALKALRDRGDCPFVFFFIGKQSEKEPERYDDCYRFCKDNRLLDTSVFFLGGRGDIPSVLPHLDGFVYCTECDSFGIAVVEAMAAGIPVIVNDWEVMKEISDNGEFASLYKTLDVEDCVDKIVELGEHLDERKKKAETVAGIVRNRFSIENHIRILDAVYESAMSRS